MKKYIFIAACTALVGMISGCDSFLDADNKSNVSDKEYFSTQTGFQTLVNNAYESLHDVYASSSYTSFFQAGTDLYADGRYLINEGLHQYETLTPENSAMSTLYKSCYSGIRKAYAIPYYAQWTTLDEAFRQRSIMEARALAANYYYILVNTFGGVPLMKEFVVNAEIGYPKSSAQEVYEYILSELEAVVASNALLPSTAKQGGGQVSQEAAKAMLARTYLSAAWDLSKKEYFQKAAQYADAVINNRQLTTPFDQLWDGNRTGDDNEEFLWDLEYDYASANNTVSGGNAWQGFYCNHFGGQEDNAKGSHSAFIVTLHGLQYFERGDVRYAATFMKELPYIAGGSAYSYWDYYKNGNSYLGIPIQYYYPAWYETEEDYAAWIAQDPTHRSNVIIVPQSDHSQEPSANGKAVDYETLVNYTMANPAVHKFDDGVNAKYDADRSCYRDVHILTLPDMYLTAAEAYLKAGDNATALARLNSVRQRAQVANASSIDIDAILKERACELFGQGSRWIDLRRTQKLVEYNNLYNPQIKGRAAQCIGQKLLRPLPQSAIDANEALSEADQNPGY